MVMPSIKDPELEFRKYVNFLIGLQERRERRIEASTLPITATVDPTANVCHLKCPYCDVGRRALERTRGVMRPHTHGKIMKPLLDTLFVVQYFNTGEPLLNREFSKLVAQTKGKEIFSIISTNLSVQLSDREIEDLVTCGLGIFTVSLDGASPETYNQYRREGDFALVVENMRRLVDKKRRLRLEYPLIEWRFLVFEHNRHEIKKARELASLWGVDILEFFPGSAPIDPPVGEPRMTSETDFGPAISGPAIDRARKRRDTVFRQRFGNEPLRDGKAPPEDVRWQKCDWLYWGTALFPNASVGPCCVSNLEKDDFGTLAEDGDFRRVWNNETYRTARASFPGGRKTTLVCARCPNSDAQDYQFRMTLQGILRNAPGWVLKILSQDLDRYFWKVDFYLSSAELDGILRAKDDFAKQTFPDILTRLTEYASNNQVQAAFVNSMISALAA